MTMILFLASLAAAQPIAQPPLAEPMAFQAPEQRRNDQQRAFDARRTGRILPLPEIERRVVPTMGGAQYIGFDFDSRSGIYTLKFLRDGSVIWVDVDGQTGQVVGRTGR
ncbi:hypothetical protein [Sphingomonas sp. Leaf17]|uniref:hypothetical protein n=1 Tax=Sphingomonas sp. Leaf17 TaxID=1735683 RepID=UPI000AD7E808|nr:hypothetical protein [Sphingomonas sp. Leaf17]